MGGLQVVVLGASISGCCTAAALAGPGRRVLMLERDALPDRPQQRRGVPQGQQPHVFLLRGVRELESLVPGLTDRLRACGAVPMDTGRLPWLTEWGWLPTGPPLEILSLTRPLLEHELRAAVLARPNVAVRDAIAVRGLRRSGGRWLVTLDGGEELSADVVVDAMGRSSRLPTWLREAGMPTPAESAIDAQIGYATRVYVGEQPRLPGVAVPLNPTDLRGGYAFPVEGGRWLISALGCGDRRPPRDVEGFEAALRSLPDPVLAELAASLEPVGDVAVHRQTENRRTHYERLTALPPGLLVVGDALCTFSPVYGQGISVAAMQGGVLRAHADQVTGDQPMRGLLRRLAACTRLPWLVAAGADSGYPTSTGHASFGQRLGDRWARRLTRAAVYGDRAALTALFEAYHLITPPTALLRPRVVLGGVRPHNGETRPRPDILQTAPRG